MAENSFPIPVFGDIESDLGDRIGVRKVKGMLLTEGEAIECTSIFVREKFEEMRGRVDGDLLVQRARFLIDPGIGVWGPPLSRLSCDQPDPGSDAFRRLFSAVRYDLPASNRIRLKGKDKSLESTRETFERKADEGIVRGPNRPVFIRFKSRMVALGNAEKCRTAYRVQLIARP